MHYENKRFYENVSPRQLLDVGDYLCRHLSECGVSGIKHKKSIYSRDRAGNLFKMMQVDASERFIPVTFRSLIKPKMLVWIEDGIEDVSSNTYIYKLYLPYSNIFHNRFSCSGTIEHLADERGTLQVHNMDIQINIPFIGTAMERYALEELKVTEKEVGDKAQQIIACEEGIYGFLQRKDASEILGKYPPGMLPTLTETPCFIENVHRI